MLKERQKAILNAVVKEYIETAEPVASAQVAEKYDFPWSSATIRNDFLALDKMGYLYQPHVSAGRIPTDKGYRFFVDENFSSSPAKSPGNSRRLKPLLKIYAEDKFVRTVAKTLSELTQSLAMVRFLDEELFYKSGFAEVLREPEFNDFNAREEFAKLVDCFDDALENVFHYKDIAEPLVFIGDENPIREARKYSMIIAGIDTPFNKQGVIGIVGPKRMDYQSNISILRALQELL